MSNTDKIFVDGMIVKRREQAPAWVLCNLSIKVADLKAFLDQHERDGWVKIDCCVGKTGKHYASLDTWRPTQGEAAQQGMEQARAAAAPDSFDDNVPF